jgi:hypothetical protein
MRCDHPAIDGIDESTAGRFVSRVELVHFIRTLAGQEFVFPRGILNRISRLGFRPQSQKNSSSYEMHLTTNPQHHNKIWQKQAKEDQECE